MLNNLLNLALRVIKKTPVSYEKFKENAPGFGGVMQPQYEEPKTVLNAICEPLTNEMYKELGLDFQKEYFRVFMQGNANVLDGGKPSPDRLTFNGKTWIVIKNQVWSEYDGWCEIVCVNQKDYA